MPNDHYIQKAEELNRARGYHVAAVVLLEKGFTSEAARKEAIDYLNRAYDVLVKDGIHYALWSQRTDAGNHWVWDNAAAQELDEKHNVPDLHVWAPKHAALYAAYSEQVRVANMLKADRDAIKAAPLVARKPSKTAIKVQQRAAVAKTCQICGRPILAERGKIAHHGYQRPGQGWQTASCYGALHLPFEISRDRLGSYIEVLRGHLQRDTAVRARFAAEELPIWVDYFTGKYDGKKQIVAGFHATRATYALDWAKHRLLAYYPGALLATFDEVLNKKLHQLDREITDLTRYIVQQQARYDAWKKVA